jgi:hypothetical protein
MKANRPVTTYPDPELKRAMERIAEDDHGRPLCKVIELAMKAWCVSYQRNKWEALKLADEFGQEAGK